MIFSEKVKGVSKKSLYIPPEGGRLPMRSIVDSRKRFQPGAHIVHATTKIKDVAGNSLSGGESIIAP